MEVSVRIGTVLSQLNIQIFTKYKESLKSKKGLALYTLTAEY